MARKPRKRKEVEALTHGEDARRNIPTAELESVMSESDKSPVRVAYERRNRDLDPQLVWRGKDEQDETDLVVQAPPLYIQEKIHPKVLIDDLSRQSTERAQENAPDVPDLFADFNGLTNLEAKTEFYQHDQNWSNRMILGDSLQVMASLAEREGLRGKVQCIYVDPPYGIKFKSNFQWSTTSRNVRDGKKEHITREPEQVKAFRDTWRHGIHSYLTYLRDRLTVARDLLTESGSIFVQIGSDNVHRVRVLMDEVFGEENSVTEVLFKKTGSHSDSALGTSHDHILWYARQSASMKFRRLTSKATMPSPDEPNYVHVLLPDGTDRRMTSAERRRETALPRGCRIFRHGPITGQDPSTNDTPKVLAGTVFLPEQGRHWSTTNDGIERAIRSGRVRQMGNFLSYVLFWDELPGRLSNIWNDTQSGGFVSDRLYVVQTTTKVLERCILMCTDPGDLVLDPTCGSGTSATVAEQWGRRWITIDTSRVALTLARTRVMGARYPYYLLADSRDGQLKEAEISRKAPSESPTYGDIGQGFVYEGASHVTLKSIASNAEIDVAYERLQPAVQAALSDLNRSLRGHLVPYPVATGGRRGASVRFDAGESDSVALPSGERVSVNELLEWEVPREAPTDWPATGAEPLARFWEARVNRQREIDATITTHADFEYLYDKPYVDNDKVRVAGPLTVESLTPHRVLEAEAATAPTPHGGQVADARGEYLVGGAAATETNYNFRAVILDQLRTAGVQQADKRGRIAFTSLTGWPGEYICAEGLYREGTTDRRAGVLIGPEHGTVSRADLIAAAREAGDAGFDILIGCAFNYDAQSTDTNRLGRLPILKARMNADLQMSTDLKKTKGGNLFVIFGEPDIEVLRAEDDRIQVRINGVDLFDPRTGEVRSSEAEDLACWFIDTDYDMESFFVRHAYFLGANDPYKALKTTLRAEIDAEAWQSLRSDTSRPFRKPTSGRIAVKAINHLGDEVMKVVAVE